MAARKNFAFFGMRTSAMTHANSLVMSAFAGRPAFLMRGTGMNHANRSLTGLVCRMIILSQVHEIFSTMRRMVMRITGRNGVYLRFLGVRRVILAAYKK
jgi:hypothetical protein